MTLSNFSERNQFFLKGYSECHIEFHEMPVELQQVLFDLFWDEIDDHIRENRQNHDYTDGQPHWRATDFELIGIDLISDKVFYMFNPKKAG